MRGFYCRRWAESRGDDFDGWGHSVWYFEVDEGGWPVRQVVVYDSGPVLRYGPDHEEDQYGGLALASLDDWDEDWSNYRIGRDEFERVLASGVRAISPTALTTSGASPKITGPLLGMSGR